MSNTLHSATYSAAIILASLSDHHAIKAKFVLPTTRKKAPHWIFNTTLISNDDFCSQFKSKLQEFISLNIDSVEDFRFVWEAIKSFIKDNVTSFASFSNRSHRLKTAELARQLASLEKAQQSSFCTTQSSQLSLVKSELNAILRVEAEFLIQKSREHHYFNGSKPSHEPAMRLHSNERRACISEIKSADGNTVTSPNGINTVFLDFYEKLYTSEVTFNKDEHRKFLSDLHLEKLSSVEADDLGANISLKELWDAIQEMNLGKSPGPDGIPIEV